MTNSRKLNSLGKEKQELNDDWSSPRAVMLKVIPKLIPFFKTVAIYFVIVDRETPAWFPCILKCLPILWLCVFVILFGISFHDKHIYSRRILLGLIFSCMGDALLVWPNCFIYGMMAFGIAHIFYISAFGFRPLNLKTGVVFGVIGVLGYIVLYPGLKNDPILRLAVPFYNLILVIMLWRSVARVQLFDDLWTWAKLCSCVGGILFTISDTFVGLREFGLITHLISPRHCQLLIMLTYYAAQLGIALSVLESKVINVDINNGNSSKQTSHIKDVKKIHSKSSSTQSLLINKSFKQN